MSVQDPATTFIARSMSPVYPKPYPISDISYSNGDPLIPRPKRSLKWAIFGIFLLLYIIAFASSGMMDGMFHPSP